MQSLVLFWLTSYLLTTWAVHCPFPGLTANAQFNNKSISWEKRTSFPVNYVVEYDCVGDWKYIGKTNKYFLTCQADGTWNRPLPRCDQYLSKDKRSLEIYLDLSFPRLWSVYDSCRSDQMSNYYLINLPKGIRELSQIGLKFCDEKSMEHYEDTTLQEMKSCKKTKPKVIYYSCDDATVFGDFFAFNMKMATPLDDIFVHANPGNHCGWPPVPVNGDITTDLVPGDTTEVTYKCADPFILDRKELETGTCDQLTGQWTQPPKCICPHPQVANGQIIRRKEHSADFQCRDGYHLIGNGTATCTETGTWISLPSCELQKALITSIAVGFALAVTVIILVIWVLKLKEKCCFEQTAPMKSATSKGLNEMINFKQMGCVGSLKEYVEPIYDEPNDAQNGETYMAMNVPTNNCREPFYENSYSRNHPHPQGHASRTHLK